MSEHTRASSSAAGLTAALGLLQTWWAWAGPENSLSLAVLGSASLATATALCWANRLETRLPVVLAAFAQIGLTVLATGPGLPGQDREPLDVTSSTALGLALAVLVGIELDRRARRHRDRSTALREAAPGAPYAR